jgi:uncharacterized repeat protein (TIGR03803 family)
MLENGKFYGVTVQGGSNNLGAIYEFDPISSNITLKASFNGANGSSALGALTPTGNANGTYYGTTNGGGTAGSSNGVVYEFNINTNTITFKSDITFPRRPAPYGPTALTPSGLGNGEFYFTSFGAGAGNNGGIQKFNGTTNTVVFGPGTPPGASLPATLTPSGLGNSVFYGVARNFGSAGLGYVFEFNASANTFTVKDNFLGTTNGANPWSALTRANNGNFYGVTLAGGANNLGALYEFNPSTGLITLKDSFTGAGNGSSPYAWLTLADNGKLYGTASSGGANGFGTIFEFDPNSGGINLMASFDGSGNGNDPRSGLTAVGNGKFYGTARQGGANNLGTIYEFNLGNDPAPAVPVPGPLPLLGAGAAFGWSRQLRRRVKLQQPGARPLA